MILKVISYSGTLNVWDSLTLCFGLRVSEWRYVSNHNKWKRLLKDFRENIHKLINTLLKNLIDGLFPALTLIKLTGFWTTGFYPWGPLLILSCVLNKITLVTTNVSTLHLLAIDFSGHFGHSCDQTTHGL